MLSRMNTRTFQIPVACNLSVDQKAALAEFIQDPGFDGKVGIILSSPLHHSAQESTPEQLAGGIQMLIDDAYELPHLEHQALYNWLQILLKPANTKYLGTTVCHSSDEESLRSALAAIAEAIDP